jgi:hypothetical protein
VTEPHEMFRKLHARFKPSPREEALQFLADLIPLIVEPQYKRTTEGIRDWFEEQGYLSAKQLQSVKINAGKQGKTIPQALLDAGEQPADDDKDAETMEFEIEKNIPFPSRHGKYPFGDMEIGDSIFVPGMRVTDLSSSLAYQKQFGKKFISRTVNGGTRIWRKE